MGFGGGLGGGGGGGVGSGNPAKTGTFESPARFGVWGGG